MVTIFQGCSDKTSHWSSSGDVKGNEKEDFQILSDLPKALWCKKKHQKVFTTLSVQTHKQTGDRLCLCGDKHDRSVLRSLACLQVLSALRGACHAPEETQKTTFSY